MDTQKQQHGRLGKYLAGIASLFDFTGSLRQRQPTLRLPPSNEALSGDWQAIGSDMRKALQNFAAQQRHLRVK